MVLRLGASAVLMLSRGLVSWPDRRVQEFCAAGNLHTEAAGAVLTASLQGGEEQGTPPGWL